MKVNRFATFLCIACCVTAQQARFDGNTWWRHVEVMAADYMEGRGTGTPGLQRAEAYAVDQLKKAGLAPAGTDGYYQNIKLESRRIVEAESSAALVRNGNVEALTLGEDAFFGALVDLAPQVEAPLVFLGYGLRDDKANYNDFAGLDLKGKIAVVLTGAPTGVNGGGEEEYWKQIRNTGLIGYIRIPAPNSNWSRNRRDAAQPDMHLSADEWDPRLGLKLYMYFNPTRADQLFEGTGHTASELLGLAKDRKPLPHFALPVSIRAKIAMTKTPLESANIVAKIEGSDPALKNEYVVLSAHIDHLGIGEPVNGDSIYNGALDNASGSAAVLDIAAALKRQDTRARRSLLFVWFTGEELGHLGSKFFTARPTVDASSIVADINMDDVEPLVPIRAVTAQGLEESDLGDAARRAASSQGLTFDPEPELYPPQNFVLSDQLSFAQHGVPAIKPLVGYPGGFPSVVQKHRKEIHHTPADDLKQPVNLETAGRLEDYVLQLLLDVANDSRRPEWKPNSIYKR